MTQLNREELEQIPRRYRLLVRILLKLPNPSFPFLVLKRFPEFEGIFWALIVPLVFMIYIVSNLWFFPFLTYHVGFPLNIIIGFIAPAALFVVFLRIQIERTILWWRNIHEPTKEWNLSKTVEELIRLLEKQHAKKS